MNKKSKAQEHVINMTVKDDSDFLSRFSAHETPVISSEVAQFLEASTQGLFPRARLHLRVYSDCIDDSEKKKYAAAIKSYYSDKAIFAEREIHHDTVISAILAVIGIIVLGISLIVEGVLQSSVIDIIAWVFIWEAVDITAFQKRELRVKKLRYKAFGEMDIEFKPENYSEC